MSIIIRQAATGRTTLAQRCLAPGGGGRTRFASLTLHLSAPPTTSAEVVVWLDNNRGSNYDTALLRCDLQGHTDLVWWPEWPLWLEPGDAVVVNYDNPDGITFGLLTQLEAWTS